MARTQGGQSLASTSGVREAGPADIELADGTPLYVDGGPFAPPSLPSGIRRRPSLEHRGGIPLGRSANDAPPRRPGTGPARGGRAMGEAAPGSLRPAGSGKTRVLTERLRHLIGDRGVDPSTVTALAYNTKAPDELRERCGALVSARWSPHPDTQQRRPLDLQRVRRSRSGHGPGGAPGTRPRAERLRRPPPGQHRHRAPVHRRTVCQSGCGLTSPADRRGRDPGRQRPGRRVRRLPGGAGRGGRRRLRRADLPGDRDPPA